MIDYPVNKPHAPLPHRSSILINNRHNTPERRAGSRGAVDQGEIAVDGDDVVCAVGGYVGEGAHGAGIVVLR